MKRCIKDVFCQEEYIIPKSICNVLLCRQRSNSLRDLCYTYRCEHGALLGAIVFPSGWLTSSYKSLITYHYKPVNQTLPHEKPRIRQLLKPHFPLSIKAEISVLETQLEMNAVIVR